jgi:hypothetical protein
MAERVNSARYDATDNAVVDKPFAFAQRTLQQHSPSADRRGKRIGILIVAYNAVTTLAKVLQRIPVDVWDNVEEVVVFDDASKDSTYELGIGYKAVSCIEKLRII